MGNGMRRRPNPGWGSADSRLHKTPEDYDRERFGEGSGSFGTRERKRTPAPLAYNAPNTKEIRHPEWLDQRAQVAVHALKLARIIDKHQSEFSELIVISQDLRRSVGQLLDDGRPVTINGKKVLISTQRFAQGPFIRDFYNRVAELAKHGKVPFDLREIIDFWLPQHRRHLRKFFLTHAAAMRQVIRERNLRGRSEEIAEVLQRCNRFAISSGRET
jgi:hypothetical protein